MVDRYKKSLGACLEHQVRGRLRVVVLGGNGALQGERRVEQVVLLDVPQLGVELQPKQTQPAPEFARVLRTARRSELRHGHTRIVRKRRVG